MTFTINHAFTDPKADGTDNTLVRPSDWNAGLVTSMSTSFILGRATAGTGPVEEIGVTGSGNVVLANSPSLVTPTLGAAVATTINGAAVDNSAWNTNSITVTAGVGTLTTVAGTCRWKQIGKTIFFQIDILITTNGTGSSFIRSTNLPFTLANVANGQSVSGYIPQIGCGLAGVVGPNNSTITIFKFDATYPGADGNRLLLSAAVEST